jgi:hypothetical protein
VSGQGLARVGCSPSALKQDKNPVAMAKPNIFPSLISVERIKRRKNAQHTLDAMSKLKTTW